MTTARDDLTEQCVPNAGPTAELIHRLAEGIVVRRLELPATLFLEMHLPVTTLIHASTLLLEPLVSPLFGAERVHTFSQLLAERKNVERLIREIQERVALRDARAKCGAA
ncbi:MAG: hypothetical protein U0136_06960 [Bdellovibrionota bacterium]